VEEPTVSEFLQFAVLFLIALCLVFYALDRLAACMRPSHPARAVVQRQCTSAYRVRGEGGLERSPVGRSFVVTATELRYAPRLLLGELWVEAG
jgi:hypothetical protein